MPVRRGRPPGPSRGRLLTILHGSPWLSSDEAAALAGVAPRSVRAYLLAGVADGAILRHWVSAAPWPPTALYAVAPADGSLPAPRRLARPEHTRALHALLVLLAAAARRRLDGRPQRRGGRAAAGRRRPPAGRPGRRLARPARPRARPAGALGPGRRDRRRRGAPAHGAARPRRRRPAAAGGVRRRLGAPGVAAARCSTGAGGPTCACAWRPTWPPAGRTGATPGTARPRCRPRRACARAGWPPPTPAAGAPTAAAIRRRLRLTPAAMDALHAVALRPLLTADQVAWAADLAPRTAHAALAELAAEGLVAARRRPGRAPGASPSAAGRATTPRRRGCACWPPRPA